MYEETTAMKHPEECLSKEQVEKLLDVMDNPRDKLLFKTQFALLLRIGEVVGNKLRECVTCGLRFHPTRVAVETQCHKCWHKDALVLEIEPKKPCPKCGATLKVPDLPRKEWKWTSRYIQICPQCKTPCFSSTGKKRARNFKIVKEGGLRLSDIVQTKEGYLAGVHSEKKRGKPVETVPISETLYMELSEYCLKNGIGENQIIFNITRQRAQDILKKYAVKAGFDPQALHTHVFRHSSISHVSEDAETVAEGKVVQRLARHSRFEITLRTYIHPKKSTARKLANLLDMKEG